MNVLRCIAIVLLLAMAAGGCGRKESTRVVAPLPEQKAQVLEAHWVFERDALRSAVELAASSPLVRRAIAESPSPRLTPVTGYALRAEGKVTGDVPVGATILPYIVDGDSTHAVFFSLLERDGKHQAESSELILGREPTSLETGFTPIRIGDRIGWIKGGNAYVAGADGLPRLSPQKFKWMKFIECLLDNAPGACAAGADIGRQIAPGSPYAGAVGCGVGVAVVAIGCAAGSF